MNKFPDAPRDTTSDSNGDGTPNFIEMMLDLDPFAKPKPISPADPRAAEKLEKRRAESRRRTGQAIAPYLNDGIRDSNGDPVTRADLKAATIKKSRTLGVRLEAEAAARMVRIQTYLDGPGAHLDESKRDQLRDVIDGEPRFISYLSHEQAYELAILQLWPGGSSNNNLTGLGAIVARWDQGAVAATHEQFGISRIESGDNSVVANEHATAVATVIIGAGDSADTNVTDYDLVNFPSAFPNSSQNNARGMAYNAKLRAYNTTEDLKELRTLAEEAVAGTHTIVFSNHAYGTRCGYQRYQSSMQTIWDWYGDPALGTGTSDWKHGFYLSDRCIEIDEIVELHKIFLPIWAAGNEDTNFDLVDSPEPEEAGSSSSVAHMVITTGVTYTGVTYTEQNAPERNNDSSTDAFKNAANNLIPEACSKNVLSVGSLNGASSKGPTDDLRIKPDIVSCASGGSLSLSADHVGDSSYRNFEGTSFAAASVTGGMALVRQRWLQLNATSEPVLASTWKGLAIATAGGTNFNDFNLFQSGGNAPDKESGYGLFDPLDCVHVIEEDFSGRSAGTSARIMEILLEEGDEARFNIRSSEPLVDNPFRVAICWTDPKGPPVAKSLDPRNSQILINDIDLEVLRPNDTALEPWRLRSQSTDENNENYDTIIRDRGDNTRDNVEVVDGTLADFGSTEYTVKITRKVHETNKDPQLVSIIIVGDAEAVTPPFRIVNFAPSDEFNPNIYAVTWLTLPGAIYQIESSDDLTSWIPIPVEISAIGSRTTTGVNMTGLGDRQFIRVRRLD